jgi:D-alanyl-D-alanine endopeptidase (penicillin-binding protein 7)
MARYLHLEFMKISNRILYFVGLTLFSMVVTAHQAQANEAKRHHSNKGNATSVKHKTSLKLTSTRQRSVVRADVIPMRPSFGQIAGLHGAQDSLALKSSVALVVDQDTNEVLFSKNDRAVLPIASLTKLMTGVVLSEAHLPMDEIITITQADVDTEKGSSSRLKVGASLSRGEMMHLALMSSENRAAHALGRSYPGGLPVFVELMNAKAKSLGMKDTNYVEPTGLNSKNQSSAHDLAKLVNFAYGVPILRELTTSPGYQVEVGNRTLQYNNTNRLVKSPAWDIGLQKTGYITEAGQCLVMQAKVAGRKVIMVFLDSAGKFSRLADAERVRHWVESIPVASAGKPPVAVVLSGEKLASNLR